MEFMGNSRQIRQNRSDIDQMAIFSIRNVLCIFILSCCMISFSYGRTEPSFWVKAVNLGGWLVTEGWIKPSFFDGIPNRDLMDGAGLQFKSVTVGKYLCAELGGGSIIVANRTDASGWETFSVWRMNETTFQFRVFNKQFAGLDTANPGNNVVATSNTPDGSETFQIVRNSDDPNRVRIRAPNGFFLQVKTGEVVTADSRGDGGWGDNDPSIFVMRSLSGPEGESLMVMVVKHLTSS